MNDTPSTATADDQDPVLLWWDTETMGLGELAHKVVEVAWQFTTLEGQPLTDPQSKLCAIGSVAQMWRDNIREGTYSEVILGPDVQYARLMHLGSGLAGAHATTPGFGVWKKWSDVFGALVAEWPTDSTGRRRTAHLAGMGVAQFDLPVLQHALRQQSLASDAQAISSSLHYRPFDVSVANAVMNRTGGKPNILASVSAALDAVCRGDLPVWVASAIDEVNASTGCPHNEDTGAPVEHRAAADIVYGRLLDILLSMQSKGLTVPWVN